jgi:molybdenum cofactor biosynthesis enzyme MoaA
MCPFCCNIENDAFSFDYDKFKEFIDETASKIEINKITFTGGEPYLNAYDLYRCIEYVKGRCNQIVLFTNGLMLYNFMHNKQTAIAIYHLVDNISVSRHHWDATVNANLMLANYSDNIFAFNRGIMDKVNLSCNLIKGYVDNFDGMLRMLEFASEYNINEVAFVNLIKANDYCRDHFVDIKIPECKRILEYDGWDFPIADVCRCRNYVYIADNLQLVKFYTRANLSPDFNKGSFLVYKNNKLQSWYKENCDEKVCK